MDLLCQSNNGASTRLYFGLVTCYLIELFVSEWTLCVVYTYSIDYQFGCIVWRIKRDSEVSGCYLVVHHLRGCVKSTLMDYTEGVTLV